MEVRIINHREFKGHRGTIDSSHKKDGKTIVIVYTHSLVENKLVNLAIDDVQEIRQVQTWK